MGNKNIKNNSKDNINCNTSSHNIETESDNKTINYKEIEYPLNDIKNIIEKNNSKDYTNCYTLDPNIEIEYDNINNIPSIYRCPVCLCIPFIIYNKKICYFCNCGYHKCSVDYFLTNFISYPINAVNLKNNDDIELSKIYFCQVCSKFIINIEEHQSNYYGHPIKNINNIFQKTEEENYNCYEIHLDNYIYGKNINKISETFGVIKYSNFIKKNLNLSILEKIENCYKIFSTNKEMKNEELIEKKKLYLFSKFLYYVFQKNITENTLVFQIIINIYFIIIQINKKNFLNDYTNCKFDIYYKFTNLLTDNIIEFTPKKIFYDNYSQRYVLWGKLDCGGEYQFLITKKNDIENIFIKSSEVDFCTVLYFKEWNKNLIIFKKNHKISLIDIENLKYIYEFYVNFGEIKDIILINNKYYVFHSMSHIILCTFPKVNNKNDNININFNIDKINFIYANSKFNCEQIYNNKKMLILKNKSNLKFSKINKDGNDLEELFNLNVQTEFYIDIQFIGKKRIIIIYKQYGRNIIKFEIYDIEAKQKIFFYNNINNRLKELIFIGGNYFIGIINDKTDDYELNIYNSNNLKKISNLTISKNICSIFFRKNSDKYILISITKKLNYLVKIKNGNLENIKDIGFLYYLENLFYIDKQFIINI